MSDFRSRLPRPWQQPLISLPKLLLSYPVRTRSSKPIAPKAPKVRELLFDREVFSEFRRVGCLIVPDGLSPRICV